MAGNKCPSESLPTNRRTRRSGWSRSNLTNGSHLRNHRSQSHRYSPTSHHWSRRNGSRRLRRLRCNHRKSLRWSRLSYRRTTSLKKMSLNWMCPDAAQRLNQKLKATIQRQVRIVSRRTSMVRGLGGGLKLAALSPLRLPSTTFVRRNQPMSRKVAYEFVKERHAPLGVRRSLHSTFCTSCRNRRDKDRCGLL